MRHDFRQITAKTSENCECYASEIPSIFIFLHHIFPLVLFNRMHSFTRKTCWGKNAKKWIDRQIRMEIFDRRERGDYMKLAKQKRNRFSMCCFFLYFLCELLHHDILTVAFSVLNEHEHISGGCTLVVNTLFYAQK